MSWKKQTLTYKVPGGAIYRVRYYRSSGAPGTPIQIRVLDRPGCRYTLGVHAHLLEHDYICIAEGTRAYDDRAGQGHRPALDVWLRGVPAQRGVPQRPGALRRQGSPLITTPTSASLRITVSVSAGLLPRGGSSTGNAWSAHALEARSWSSTASKAPPTVLMCIAL